MTTGAFFHGSRLRIARIAAVFVCFAGAEIHVDDVSDSLDVHHLSHDLTAGVDSDHVVTGLDDRTGAPAAEESAAATALASTAGAAQCRGFSGAQVDLARCAAAAALSTTSAGESSSRLHPLTQSAHTGRVATRAHRGHAVPRSPHSRRICGWSLTSRFAGVAARGAHRVLSLAPQTRGVDAIAKRRRTERTRTLPQIPVRAVQAGTARTGEGANRVAANVGDENPGGIARGARGQTVDQLRAIRRIRRHEVLVAGEVLSRRLRILERGLRSEESRRAAH